VSDAAGRVPILMYHSIATAPNDATRALSVAPEAFAEQLALLGDLGFTPLNTADLAASWRSGKPLPERPVLITFDDGYEGVHRHALPVLAQHGFASTLFVSTGWIRGAHDTGGGLDTMLDWDQVRELAGADVEIGGHSHTHPQLDQLDDDAPCARAGPLPGDRRRRTRRRTRLVRVSVRLLQPPGAPAVREAGFAQALAVGNDLARRRQGPYALRRVTVRRSTGIEEFERLVEGRAIARNFARDRALTKGYAMVRRARQVRRKAIRSRV
jgi:peptidoglycan/xylan/chitin deacetylase (PgdA/CDA1 family)